MPLKCLNNDQALYAFSFADVGAWEDLRAENAKRHHLRMPCCDALVTLKTSKLGTRYFAHARIGSCATNPESAEHLLAKTIIAQSAISVGWQATSEHSGRADTGRDWIADVMAQRDGKRPVAFEVQWTRQVDEETRARQSRYQSSRVRALWLFRQHDFPSDHNIPAFRLIHDADANSFSVGFPSPRYSPSISRKESQNSEYWQQIVPLSDFICGALEGRLRFAPARDQSVPMEILTTTKHCYACGCETKIVNWMEFRISHRFPKHPDARVSIDDFENVPGGAKILRTLLPSDLLRRHNIGEVKPRRRRGRSEPELSNGCAHCGVLHGHEYDLDDIETLEVALTVPVRLDPAWIDHIELDHVINRWWFAYEPISIARL